VPLNPDDVLEEWHSRAQRVAEDGLAFAQRLRQVSAVAESADGEVRVTVDHAGGLSVVTLADHAMRLAPEELSSLIVATSKMAQAQLAQIVAELVSRLHGADSPTTDFVAGAYAEAFPDPDPGDGAGYGRR
jgi:DNA-binding protein YbaB